MIEGGRVGEKEERMELGRDGGRREEGGEGAIGRDGRSGEEVSQREEEGREGGMGGSTGSEGWREGGRVGRIEGGEEGGGRKVGRVLIITCLTRLSLDDSAGNASAMFVNSWLVYVASAR